MKSSAHPRNASYANDTHHVIRDKDESAAAGRRLLIGRLLQNSVYRFLMTAVIISDCVIVALQIDPVHAKDHGTALSVLENIVHAILIGKIAIKWYFSFEVFRRSGWNVVNLLVTLTVILGPKIFPAGGGSLLKVMRVLRVFRGIVGILVVRRFAAILKVIADSVPEISPILLFFVIILLLFSLCGVNMFPTSPHFSDLGAALYTLFICLTQDGWVVIFREFRTSENGMEYYGGMLFFMMFICVGGFIFANLFATINSNLVPDDIDEGCPEGSEDELSEGEGILGEEDELTDQEVRPEPCTLSMITDTLRDLDRNLSEYDLLYQEFKSIVKDIHSLPANQEHEQEGIMKRRRVIAKFKSDLARGRNGDILSTLITQQKAHIFDSKSDMPTLLRTGTRHTAKKTRLVRQEEAEEHSDHT